jgi:hypothetical protein
MFRDNLSVPSRTGDADLRLYAYKQFKYPVPNVLKGTVYDCSVCHRNTFRCLRRKYPIETSTDRAEAAVIQQSDDQLQNQE